MNTDMTEWKNWLISTNDWENEWMNKWIYECIIDWLNECNDEGVNLWMKE